MVPVRDGPALRAIAERSGHGGIGGLAVNWQPDRPRKADIGHRHRCNRGGRGIEPVRTNPPSSHGEALAALIQKHAGSFSRAEFFAASTAAAGEHGSQYKGGQFLGGVHGPEV